MGKLTSQVRNQTYVGFLPWLSEFLKSFSEKTVEYPVFLLSGIQFEIQLICRLVPFEAVPFDLLVAAAYRNSAELSHHGFAYAVAPVFGPDIKVFDVVMYDAVMRDTLISDGWIQPIDTDAVQDGKPQYLMLARKSPYKHLAEQFAMYSELEKLANNEKNHVILTP